MTDKQVDGADAGERITTSRNGVAIDVQFETKNEIGTTSGTSDALLEGYTYTNVELVEANTNGTCTENAGGNGKYADDKDNSDECNSDEATVLATLEPPISCSERARDYILRGLDLPVFQWTGIAVLVLVIADGALFFFLLMGWQTLCHEPKRTDCEPRNWWYNWSIQILNVLFTYMAVVSLPWRAANFLHLTGTSCPPRSHQAGRNLYGLPDPELWFHVPVSKRLGITIVLLLNCLFQFINHGTRVYYYNYDRQEAAPGNIWTNVFFAAAFLCAAIGGAWMGMESVGLRKAHPGKFGPGPIDALKHWCAMTFKHKKESEEEAAVANEEEGGGGGGEHGLTTGDGGDGDDEHRRHHHHHQHVDPTRETKRRSILAKDRAAMRMWAM